MSFFKSLENKNNKKSRLKLPSFSLIKLKNNKSTFIKGGIVTIDPYTHKVYNYSKNIVKVGSINFYDKKNHYISYIYQKDFIVGQVEIPRSISSEDLQDAIEIAVFDEFNLDSSQDYIMHYVGLENTHSDNKSYAVFAISYDKLYSIFSQLKSIKHLDVILPSPLLYTTLYSKNILKESAIDCFLHFDYGDTVLTIYKNGEYLYSKSLTFSLKKINEEFARSLAQHVDENDFFKLLVTQGLMSSDSVVQKNLMKIFSDLFSYINDVLQFVKRSLEVESIDRIYILSKIGDIRGLKEFCENILSIPTNSLDLKISKNSSEINIDPISELMILYMREYIANPNDDFNFSIFKKEPPFFTTPSGKLIKTIAATLIISLAYPLYQIGEKYIFDKKYEELNLENNLLLIKVNNMKATIASLSKQKEEIEKNLKDKEKNLAFKTKLLKEIYQKKVSYIMKAKILNNLFEKINKHNTKVEKVLNHKNSFILSVRSKRDKDITELIDDLAKNQNYIVGTNLIVKDQNFSYYRSDIKVDVYASR